MRTFASAAATTLLLTGCAPSGPAGAGQAADDRPAAYPYLQGAPPGPAQPAPTRPRPQEPQAAFTVLATGDLPTAPTSLAALRPALSTADLILCPHEPPHREPPTGLAGCLDGGGVRNVRGVAVAVVAADAGQPVAEILAAAHEARQAGAGAVVVSLQWGAAGKSAAGAGQITLAQRLLATPDVDLIVGHGAHVVQPYARATNGKWVAYGLGDLAGRAGVLGRFTFSPSRGRWTVSKAAFTPTVTEHGAVLDVPAELAGPGLPRARRAALKTVQDRTAKIVYSRHTLPALIS